MGLLTWFVIPVFSLQCFVSSAGVSLIGKLLAKLGSEGNRKRELKIKDMLVRLFYILAYFQIPWKLDLIKTFIDIYKLTHIKSYTPQAFFVTYKRNILNYLH